jgi:transposase
MSGGGKLAVAADDQVVAAAELRRLEERVRGFERLLGRKTLEWRSSKRRSSAHGKKRILLSRNGNSEGTD